MGYEHNSNCTFLRRTFILCILLSVTWSRVSQWFCFISAIISKVQRKALIRFTAKLLEIIKKQKYNFTRIVLCFDHLSLCTLRELCSFTVYLEYKQTHLTSNSNVETWNNICFTVLWSNRQSLNGS